MIYVLGILVALNLAATVALWFRKPAPSPETPRWRLPSPNGIPAAPELPDLSSIAAGPDDPHGPKGWRYLWDHYPPDLGGYL